MEARVSLITLGVTDLARARRFYEALGWEDRSPEDSVAFFQCGGMVVGLWSRAALAEDSEAVDTGGWGGVTLAHNVRTREEVDAVLAEVVAAGGEVLRPAADTFYGGYSGIVADPDGHRWEIAHNPFWRITDDGETRIGPE